MTSASGPGNYASALDDYRSALELSRRIGDVYQEALAHDGLGRVLLRAEGAAAAGKHWRRALELFERIGVPEADADSAPGCAPAAASPGVGTARYADLAPRAHRRRLRMADPITMAIATAVAGKAAESHDRPGQASAWPPSYGESGTSSVAARPGRPRSRPRSADPGSGVAGRRAGPRPRRGQAPEDPEFGTQLRELSRPGSACGRPRVTRASVNVFHGRAGKVVQLRDVHGDLSIG